MTRTLNASLIFVAAALSATVASAAPASYAIEPTHTFATFEAKHFGTSTVHGRFDKSPAQ